MKNFLRIFSVLLASATLVSCQDFLKENPTTSLSESTVYSNENVLEAQVFGIYAAMYSVENTDGPLAFWSSMFPLTSPIVMMVRVPFNVPVWQEVLSLVILYGTALLFVYVGARIYRVGILMYGKKPSIKEICKWIRYK